jgi:hypothetical protein
VSGRLTRPAVVGAVSFLLLFARGAAQVPADWLGEWDRETVLLVTSSVFHKAREGAWTPMGYPYRDGEPRTEWRSREVYEPYLRQVGLVATALAVLAPEEEAAMSRFLLASRYGFLALAAAAAAAFIAVLAARVGPVAGVGALLALLVGRYFGEFARGPYWTLFLAIAVVAAFWYVALRSAGRPGAWFWPLFGALVFVECLNGYEYLTTLLLAPLSALGYLVGVRALAVREALRAAVLTGAAGVAGFALAFGTHVAYLFRVVGRELALQNTVLKAWQRTLGEPVTLRSHAFGVYSVLAHDKWLTALLFLWAVGGVMLWRWRRGQGAERRGLVAARRGRLDGLWLASAIAIGGALSWLVVARSHAAIAPQFNMLPFYYGATALIGAFLAELVVSVRGGHGQRA